MLLSTSFELLKAAAAAHPYSTKCGESQKKLTVAAAASILLRSLNVFLLSRDWPNHVPL
jgi:anaerobic glycerol-3-phosphate dehydrogenase